MRIYSSISGGGTIAGTITNTATSGDALDLNGTYAYGIDANAGTYSTSAVIRFPNNRGIAFRNAANSADLLGIFINSSNELQLAQASFGNLLIPSGNTLRFGDPVNIQTGTGTGTIIATGTTQKLGFWNQTAVGQWATTASTGTFTSTGGTAALSGSTWVGNTGTKAYSVSDLVSALKTCGIIAA